MQVRPPALLLPGQQPGREAEAKARTKAAGDFEALLVTRLLKTARSAKLGDDLMGSNDQIRDLIDQQQGRIIAGAAPLGLAQLLARGARP
jgi:Rod binding domain-containing protein